MGINSKMLNTTLPRCIQVSCVHIPSEEAHSTKLNRKTIKLIKCDDGDLKIYDRPVKAMELMQEFPKHMVCRSDSFYLGQKTPPLSQNDKLQPGNFYFLLPSIFFQSALSFATLIRCRTAFSGKGWPFEVVKTPSGSLRIKVLEEMIVKSLLKDGEENDGDDHHQRVGRVCTTPQLRKEYETLVARRQWKPKLDIIKEKKKKRSSNGKKSEKSRLIID